MILNALIKCKIMIQLDKQHYHKFLQQGATVIYKKKKKKYNFPNICVTTLKLFNRKYTVKKSCIINVSSYRQQPDLLR